METQRMKNTAALKDFVTFHDLSNSYSSVHFNAIISIRTAENNIENQQLQILITFDGYDNYGTVTFLHHELDSLKYPTDFHAKWQDMHHINNEYLLIKGHHKQNPRIGEYDVQIIPLQRIMD